MADKNEDSQNGRSASKSHLPSSSTRVRPFRFKKTVDSRQTFLSSRKQQQNKRNRSEDEESYDDDDNKRQKHHHYQQHQQQKQPRARQNRREARSHLRPHPGGISHRDLSPKTAFRESIYDAMADPEGASYWEGVYGQPIHEFASAASEAASSHRAASSYSARASAGWDSDHEDDDEQDEAFAAYVRRRMWERSYEAANDERQRQRREAAKEEAKRKTARADYNAHGHLNGGFPEEGHGPKHDKSRNRRRQPSDPARKHEQPRRPENKKHEIWKSYIDGWEKVVAFANREATPATDSSATRSPSPDPPTTIPKQDTSPPLQNETHSEPETGERETIFMNVYEAAHMAAEEVEQQPSGSIFEESKETETSASSDDKPHQSYFQRIAKGLKPSRKTARTRSDKSNEKESTKTKRFSTAKLKIPSIFGSSSSRKRGSSSSRNTTPVVNTAVVPNKTADKTESTNLSASQTAGRGEHTLPGSNVQGSQPQRPKPQVAKEGATGTSTSAPHASPSTEAAPTPSKPITGKSCASPSEEQPPSLPWPCLTGRRDDLSPAKIREFFKSAPDAFERHKLKVANKPIPADIDLKPYLKSERIRWHPDRIMRMLGPQYADEDIIKAVTMVFQTIDMMWQESRARRS